jgi:hypothetical protein
MTEFNEQTLGKYFRKDGKIYCHIIYCAHPTAELRSLDGERIDGAVGSLLLSGFEPLTEEENKFLNEVLENG